MTSTNYRVLVYLLSIAIFVTSNLSFANNDDDYGIILPDIGDPASAILSINQEIELGKILVAQVNQRLPVSEDPELRNYLQSLGTRLISGGLNSDFPFYFRLVFDPRINAFAMPGGIVAINSGLLLLSQSESELASVVAHEISHVSQRHIARRFSRQQKLSVLNTIALLGTVLATIYGGEAGQAAGTATLGAFQDASLSYSRAFEQEADRIGMSLLINANLDPFGMPRFFERLNSHSKINQSRIPEFLRSHPLTTSRISDSKIRAEQFKGRRYNENTVHYQYAKARAIGISSEPNTLVSRYQKLLEEEPNNLTYYILSIALNRLGRGKQALRALDKITPNNNERFPIAIARAQAFIIDRQIDKALEILQDLDDLYPQNEAVIYYMATALLEDKNPKKALDKLDTLSKDITGNPAIERLRARAADGAGLPWRSHEALSNYDLMHARFSTAMEHLLIAERQTGIDAHSKARIQAKKQRLREFQNKHK
ncbi:MAG: M48 family metalloprotease [Gammaproteobacteria bacterium]|nr:M48 family metalloprotease [Gammaproteobacteria bacterium]